VDPALLLVAGLAVILLLQFSRVRRQQRQVRETQAGIEVGAEVLTAAGMVGTVVVADDATVTLQAEDGTRTRWVRAAIVRVITADEPASSRYAPPATTDVETGTDAGTDAGTDNGPDAGPADGNPRND
jgi:preprotein translocase subunit YajC